MNLSNWTVSQRMLLANGLVVAVGFVLLAATPVTVSSRIRTAELLILGIGAIAMLLANWLLVRKALEPLDQLAEEMDRVQLGKESPSFGADRTSIREVEAVHDAFTAMVSRLAEERRQTSRAVLAAQEGERLRVARELHDEVGQALIALLLKVERAAMGAPPELATQLEEIAADLHFDLDEVRRIARELRPEMLEDLGLVNALIALTAAAGAAGEPAVDRDLPAELPELSGEQELVVYRVAQEAVNNALRHAQASRIAVSLRAAPSELALVVSDDGQGIDPAASGGAGIQGMRERALLVGGALKVESLPGRGARVALELPVGGT